MDSGHLKNLGKPADLERELMPFWEGRKQAEAPHGVRMLFVGVRKKVRRQRRKEAGLCPAGKHPTWTRLRWRPGRAAAS